MIRPVRSFRIAPIAAAALVTLMASAGAPPLAGEQPAVVDTSQEAVLAHLERTRALFLDAIAGLTPEQWSWKPAPERWSVAECAEHITRSETFIRELARKGVSEPLPEEKVAEGRGKAATILATVVDRSQRFQAPEPLDPMQAGEIRSRDEILRDFTAERGSTVELAAAHEDLESIAAPHPFLETLDLAGWLYFLSGHTERHTLQIEEVKASEGFPQR
jgi:hypothetical protein